MRIDRAIDLAKEDTTREHTTLADVALFVETNIHRWVTPGSYHEELSILRDDIWEIMLYFPNKNMKEIKVTQVEALF